MEWSIHLLDHREWLDDRPKASNKEKHREFYVFYEGFDNQLFAFFKDSFRTVTLITESEEGWVSTAFSFLETIFKALLVARLVFERNSEVEEPIERDNLLLNFY